MTVSDLDRKRFETARARLGLRAVTLCAVDSGSGSRLYVATQGALTKSFTDLTDLEQWVDRVDGKRVEAAA